MSNDDIFSNQEQIFEFYETLRNGSSDATQQFQSILEVFVCDMLKYRKEIKRLEDSYKREKETHERYLRNIEMEQEQDMREIEEKIRDTERKKFEQERELIQQRAQSEISDLKLTIQRLQTIEKRYSAQKSEDDSSTISLREEIAKLTGENQTLNASLNDTLTTNAILKSDIQSLKAQLNERQSLLLQEKQSSSGNHREKESLQTNVRHLVEVNKQLRDENDSLRAHIEANKTNSTILKTNSLPAGRLVSTAGSTLGNYWNNNKLDSPSPSYTPGNNARRFDSFDLDSTDEIGIINNRAGTLKNLATDISSNKFSSLATIDKANSSADGNNSGLSLTTGRDATEAESERDSKLNRQTSLNNKQFRPLLTKRINDYSDSDDVFVQQFPLDRSHPKRMSQHRALKRANPIAQASTGVQSDRSATPDTIRDLPFDRMFKVVFCGDAAVGKTALIMRLCKEKFETSASTTLGVDFQNKEIEVDGKRVALQLWDTAGQERFRSIAKSYFRRCDGVILVYDSTYERSFLNVREWIDTITDSTPKKVSVMIVANKIDLRDQMRAEGKRVIEKAEGEKLARMYKALFIETSAKDGTNSSETLYELARDMQCNEDLERFRTAGIDLDKQTRKKSSCCGD
ncbi:unnamed protein product [Adineta ricciae]|uniref:Uncharacterized protein n=1 Tax=Adineta ricciae TaxID=249248 RepID=A0A813RZP6_ADIRI|nr:unnamed protein product [Adineta ricciae]